MLFFCVRIVSALVIGLLLADRAFSNEVARSPEKAINLLELFSSESCSSCPPADRWFSGLKSNPNLWKKFVPVVFHVDYWNHLDWKDDFSSHEMTERQRAHASTWKESKVYTPGVVLDGLEWTHWRGQNGPPEKEGDAVGVLSIESSAEKYVVRFKPKDKAIQGLQMHIALLGMGIKNKISSGENSGQLLTHDFVVLVWRHDAGEKGSDGSFSRTFSALKAQKTAPQKAIVAWVQVGQGPRALQATGAFLH